MKLEKLVGERFKERPSDCVIDSHALMVRGGYIKYVANGIYSSFAVLRRVTRKIEQIIREEMDAVDGQEVSFPVALPASLWEESGRYGSVGKELLKFTDRNGAKMLLGMTHEEAAVQLTREYGQTYAKYPFTVYQIQTKFRDEARPRGGLIRVREFTMKDAYSFHTSQRDLELCYDRFLEAYNRIYARVGIPEVISVASDSGMMGGSLSHEFMLPTPVGEDSIVICKSCDYRANLEAAPYIMPAGGDMGQDGGGGTGGDGGEQLKLVHTPDAQTIGDVCQVLGLPRSQACKAVVYQLDPGDAYVVVFIRGDLDVNETKLRNLLKSEIRPAVITEESGICAGYTGPYRQGERRTAHRYVFDASLRGAVNLCCGANREEYHYTGLNMARDVGAVDFHDIAKAVDGGICPDCGQPTLVIARAIEVGNIFQLGTKYTEAMNMQYADQNGDMRYPLMGCYGIGVGRLAASVCEARHDEYGPIWPMSVAPWQVHLCCVRADDADTRACADALYRELTACGTEVIYDDRDVSAGVMFSDADLLGVPVRAIVSPRNMKKGCLELVTRDKSVRREIAIGGAAEAVRALVRELSDAL